MTLPTLQIIVASTRPGRIGLAYGEWMRDRAVEHGGFDVELVDLAEVALPFLDEPKHPRLGEYEHEHTRAWSATIDRGDAYVFVTPEYNHGYNAVLKNAIDFLHNEWNDKPVGFCSYGGVSAGTRSVQALKQVVTAVRMMPLFDGVFVPFAWQFIGEDGVVHGNEQMEGGAATMLDELQRLSGLLSGGSDYRLGTDL